MATVLEKCTTQEQRSLVRLLWAKGLNARDIRKEMFPVYGGKCLSRKAVHIWVQKFSQGRSKVADDETEVQKWLRECVSRTGKTMVQVYQCWWRICREINVFSRFEYHMFYVLYSFVSYLLSPLRMCTVLSRMQRLVMLKQVVYTVTTSFQNCNIACEIINGANSVP
jgi:hypothetical protein